jgi:hypothetical protein
MRGSAVDAVRSSPHAGGLLGKCGHFRRAIFGGRVEHTSHRAQGEIATNGRPEGSSSQRSDPRQSIRGRDAEHCSLVADQIARWCHSASDKNPCQVSHLAAATQSTPPKVRATVCYRARPVSVGNWPYSEIREGPFYQSTTGCNGSIASFIVVLRVPVAVPCQSGRQLRSRPRSRHMSAFGSKTMGRR